MRDESFSSLRDEDDQQQEQERIKQNAEIMVMVSWSHCDLSCVDDHTTQFRFSVSGDAIKSFDTIPHHTKIIKMKRWVIFSDDVCSRNSSVCL